LVSEVEDAPTLYHIASESTCSTGQSFRCGNCDHQQGDASEPKMMVPGQEGSSRKDKPSGAEKNSSTFSA